MALIVVIRNEKPPDTLPDSMGFDYDVVEIGLRLNNKPDRR